MLFSTRCHIFQKKKECIKGFKAAMQKKNHYCIDHQTRSGNNDSPMQFFAIAIALT